MSKKENKTINPTTETKQNKTNNKRKKNHPHTPLHTCTPPTHTHTSTQKQKHKQANKNKRKINLCHFNEYVKFEGIYIFGLLILEVLIDGVQKVQILITHEGNGGNSEK